MATPPSGPGCHRILNIEELAEVERIYDALAENGIVELPLQETFLALRFGVLVDRFATSRLDAGGQPMALPHLALPFYRSAPGD